ncbi:MAG: ribosomal protein S18-alanine N-acetyltransferase [Chloroflexi bacterium]|nr:ribosomal protein S18-alanine N-acetyltransferase [Chloroflexota bacterium]
MASILVACDSSNGVQPPRSALQGLPEDGDRPRTPGLNGLWRRLTELFSNGVSANTSQHDAQFLAGYVAMWFMTDQAHITGIAVREALRGKGLGELLLLASIQQALRRQSSVATLEVRVSNYVAQSLYAKYGFNRVGLRKGYYTDNHEDAYIMTTDPIASPEYAERFRGLLETYKARRGRVALVLG